MWRDVIGKFVLIFQLRQSKKLQSNCFTPEVQTFRYKYNCVIHKLGILRGENLNLIIVGNKYFITEKNPDSEMPDVRVINNWKHHIYVRIVSETVIYNEVRKLVTPFSS